MRFTLALLAASAVLFAVATPGQAQVPVFTPDAGAPQCRGSGGYSADFDGNRTFLWRPQWVQAIAADDDRRKEALRDADRALDRGPYSVTDKPKLPPGATPNHYASIGPYWWPDPSKKDGLPYSRRDGEVNPERGGPEFDKARLGALANDLEALSLAYFMTEDERYASHAAVLLRAWFIDPATRMLPNMDFAQGIPGRVQGRGEGIIEASDLSTVVEAVGLLTGSTSLTTQDHAALRQWYAELAAWMATSEIGLEEMQKTNNHGIFYDFYLSHFALFAGMDGVASSVVEAFPQYRLASQMDRQGRFIQELERTRSWHYSNYVVAGAARLATIGECVGKDLWQASAAPDGRNLQSAFAFLDRYSDDLPSWPFPDTDLAAGRLDRMASTHQLVRLMAAGGQGVEQGGAEQGGAEQGGAAASLP